MSSPSERAERWFVRLIDQLSDKHYRMGGAAESDLRVFVYEGFEEARVQAPEERFGPAIDELAHKLDEYISSVYPPPRPLDPKKPPKEEPVGGPGSRRRRTEVSVVNSDVIALALLSICPLWPFC